jgi:hypothetical protein
MLSMEWYDRHAVQPYKADAKWVGNGPGNDIPLSRACTSYEANNPNVRATTLSAVKPNLFITSFNGADAPNVVIPT